MINDKFLREIANIFIGDEDSYYQYKSGPKLVEFFNEEFNFSDTYRAGFPSRWKYVVDKIKILMNENKFNDFLNIILSNEYIMAELGVTKVDSIQKTNEILTKFNEKLNSTGYKIVNIDNTYQLIDADLDLEYIDEGGFATVYLIKSTNIVLKKLKQHHHRDEGILSRFKREYDMMKELADIDGILQVYDFNEVDYSYTMEKGDDTLTEIINGEFGILPEDKKISIIKNILEIMTEVHQRRQIHRDISPNNILFVNNNLKISDFGLGKNLSAVHSHQTIHTARVGHYYYTAPEQFKKLKNTDERADVFSLGRLMNFIMTGEPLDNNHFLRGIVQKATVHNRDLRYSNAGELLSNFNNALKKQNNGEKELILKKIESGSIIFNDEVESYIYSSNSTELCKDIKNSQNMAQMVLDFISKNETETVDLLEAINNTYLEVCISWDDYNNFSYLAFELIMGDTDYVAKEIAAEILSNIAYGKNRFEAQDKIEELMASDIDINLRKILQENQ